jgi:hypothetical protein
VSCADAKLNCEHPNSAAEAVHAQRADIFIVSPIREQSSGV